MSLETTPLTLLKLQYVTWSRLAADLGPCLSFNPPLLPSAPAGVTLRLTEPRYATLPNIMKAKKKPSQC